MSFLGLVITVPIVIVAGLVGILVVSMTPQDTASKSSAAGSSGKAPSWRDKAMRTRDTSGRNGAVGPQPQSSAGGVPARNAAARNATAIDPARIRRDVGNPFG